MPSRPATASTERRAQARSSSPGLHPDSDSDWEPIGRARTQARLRWPPPVPVRFGAAYTTAALLYLFGLPNLLNLPYYTGSDAGLYNAVFYQMTLGRTLYRDVFEMKDPLFFHGHALFRGLIGLSGPMLWETLITLLTFAVLFRIAWRVGLSAGQALLAVLAYVLVYFNPNIYQPIHTYHQAILLLLAAIALALEDRPVPAGVSLALALASKATLVTMGPAVLLAVLLPIARRHDRPLERLAGFAVGGVGATSAVVLFMALTHELTGYRDGVRANFGYTKLISETLGWHNDPVGRVHAVFGTPLLWVIGLAVALVVVFGAAAAYTVRARLRWKGAPTPDAPMTLVVVGGIGLACLAGFGLILREAAWFNHYYVAAAPGLFFLAVALPGAVRLLPASAFKPVGTWVAAGVFVVAPLATGFFPRKAIAYKAPECPFILSGTVPQPDQAACIGAMPFTTPPGRTYAMVGPNSGDTPIASLPKDFVLGCRLVSLFPWQGDKLLDEFIACLDTHVDVVIAEDLLHFNRPVDIARKQRIDQIIRGKFRLLGQCGRFTVWERNPPAPA